MNCPHCKDTRLVAHALENYLVSMICPACEGHWIQSFQYWKWLDLQDKKNLPEKPVGEGESLDVCDGDRARICPECTTILLRCKVGHGLDFYLDRCSHCGGIWFDKNEWEFLKSRNLHVDAHMIFSKIWQHKLMREERVAQREEWMLKQFGEDRYEEMKRFRTWLGTVEHRSAVIRFLSEEC